VLSPKEEFDREKTEIVTNAGNLVVSPNPVNTSATIRYYVPESGKVSVGFYNVLGRQIKIFVPENEQEQGIYSVNWGGINENGNSVSSGIYFCYYRYGDMSKTVKFTVLR